jgi:hypothetical protein
MRQHLRVLISLLAEMRLKVKEGTHKTSVNVRLSESLIVPMCVTAAMEPLGKWTDVETIAVIEVKKDGELTMWSVAPVSIIQDWFCCFEGGTRLTKEAKNTEYLGLRDE